MIARLWSALVAFYRVLFPVKVQSQPWQPTGYTYTTPRTHDESKAREVFAREQRQAERRRQRAAKVIAEVGQPKDNVTPLRRKA